MAHGLNPVSHEYLYETNRIPVQSLTIVGLDH